MSIWTAFFVAIILSVVGFTVFIAALIVVRLMYKAK